MSDEMVEVVGCAIATASIGVDDAHPHLAEAITSRSVVERLRDQAPEAVRPEEKRRKNAGLGESAVIRHAGRVFAGEPV